MSIIQTDNIWDLWDAHTQRFRALALRRALVARGYTAQTFHEDAGLAQATVHSLMRREQEVNLDGSPKLNKDGTPCLSEFGRQCYDSTARKVLKTLAKRAPLQQTDDIAS